MCVKRFCLDTSHFSSGSFQGPSSGALSGGANQGLTAGTIYSYTLGFEPNGNIASVNDSVIGTWNYGVSGTPGYDDMNRLLYASATAGPCAGMNISWTYDPYGNRWSQGASGSSACTIAQPSLSFTGNNNRIDNWHYDSAGNLLNDGVHSYTYDAEGRISSVDGTTQYVYDAEGHRVAKETGSGAVTASYALGLNGQQVTEMNGSGNWVHSNVFANAQLLATYDGPGTRFHLEDALGSRRVQANTDGTAGLFCLNYPFGDGLSCWGPDEDATEHHFTGKERDAESGNDYFGARYYGSNMGRFMSPDPLYLEMHRLGDPQQLNLYMYGRNNPLSITDPTGLDITCNGSRCSDYLSALQKDIKGFKIDYDKNGKVETVGDVDKKGLSKSDKAFLSAIDDTKNHVTINAIDGTSGNPGLFFGASHGASHTIAFGQAALLDAPGNAGGYTSAGLVGHETLEGYYESKGGSMSDGHDYATGLGFPGLDAGKVIGFFGNPATNMAYGFTQQWQVHGTNTVENIRMQFVSPIPAASIHSGMGAVAYPTSVEKAK